MTRIAPPPDDELACRELVELVTDYLDNALGRAERMRIDAHLADCDGCTTYLDQVLATVAAARALPPEPMPPALLESLLEAFRAGRSEV